MNPEAITEAFEPTRHLLEQLIQYAPRLTMSLAVVVVGLLLARLIRRLTRWLIEKSGLDALAERVGVARLLYAVGVQQGFAAVSSTVMWWAVAIVTMSIVAEMLGLPGVAEGLGALLEFLPRLVAATLILVGGLLAADVLRGLVERLGQQRGDLDSPQVLGRIVYYAVAAVAVTLSGEHLGLEIGLINALIQIAAAAFLFSMGLSFALGSRLTFRDIVARYYAQQMFKPGDRITIGTTTGQVARYGPVSVWLETDDGLISLPCSTLTEQTVGLAIDHRYDPDPIPSDDDVSLHDDTESPGG